jgi:uncharacterized protein (DUF1330 family)
MPKGYWLPQIDVRNMDGYKDYMAATPPAHENYGGTALVRGGKIDVVEGHARSRNVIREFPDYASALACYRSPEYQRAKPLRLPHSDIDFLIVEGFDGTQPVQTGTPPVGATGKGYWIAHVDITGSEGFKVYAAALGLPLGKFAGRYLVRGGAQEVPEGKARARTVVIEFPSYDAAHACYYSPDYQAVKKLRDGNADVDLVVVEGYGGLKF